ncbi:MAG: peptidyl-prolyl cis-trans isomerase [Candidatus Omnitrophica bacterium]|nr:peptidyl-prolyl cis-trans isomerase [Candidatus Omnitrophota bacterium]
MKKFIVSVFILAAGLYLTGCDQLPMPWGAKPKPKAKPGVEISQPPIGALVVAKVGNLYITAEDLNKEIENYNALLVAQGLTQNKIDNREEKINYLKNELVRKYTLYEEAINRRLDKRESVARDLQSAEISILVAELLRQEMEKIEVSNAEVEDFYNKNKELLKEPEERRILEIVTNNEDEAKQVYIELLKGVDFASLAKQYSKAPTASKGGDLGFIIIDPDPKKRVRFDKFYEVAFSPTLDSGGISNIFKGPDGYYIVKVESMKKSEPKTLSELRDNIKAWLLFDKQQKAIMELANKLAGGTKIEIFEGKVD